MVAISIRGYLRNGYNAVVFNQRCMACLCLGAFTLDVESYVDRVYHLFDRDSLTWGGHADCCKGGCDASGLVAT
jgi:hypothetical protein